MMKKYLVNALQCGVLILGLGIPVAAQGGAVNELKKEIETLKEGQEAIQKELQEIKNLLRARPAQAPAAPAPSAPADFILDIGENPFKGDRSARLTLVEFTDYQ